MFEFERTAANSICLIISLLITGSEGEFINQVHGGCPLTVCHDFVFHAYRVILADTVDVFLSKSQKSNQRVKDQSYL